MNSITLKLFAAVVLVLNVSVSSQSESANPGSPEEAVRELYDLVTFEAGTSPDWQKVKDLFIPEAVIVLRTSRQATTTMSVDTFVQDFVDFIEKAGVKETGFSETIVKMSSTVLKDIAHVLVLYDARITGSPRPPTRGVDSFQLIKKNNKWLIASVINEIPTTEFPVPEGMFD